MISLPQYLTVINDLPHEFTEVKLIWQLYKSLGSCSICYNSFSLSLYQELLRVPQEAC